MNIPFLFAFETLLVRIIIKTLCLHFSVVMRGTVDGKNDKPIQFGETDDKDKNGIALFKENCQTSGTYNQHHI